MKKIIINGANGYVASNFILALLKQHYPVGALVRGGPLKSGEKRMQEALHRISDAPLLQKDALTVYEYSLLDKDFGLGPAQIQELFDGPIDFFHFAASLKYKEKAREEIFEINVNGLENAIQTFLRHAGPKARFFFIGTAYSCGKTSDLFEEKFYPNTGIQDFRNYYEQSKRYAENVLKTYIDEQGLDGYVFRLGQVVGRQDTGEIHTSYGLFNVVKKLYYLASAFPDQTLRMRIDPEATQNLIPVDVLVSYLIKAIEAEHLPRILHFVAKTPLRNSDIIRCICEQIPVKVIPQKDLKREELEGLEGMIADRMQFSKNYVDTHIQFDTQNLDQVIHRQPVEMDEQSFSSMLSYFIQKMEEEIQALKTA